MQAPDWYRDAVGPAGMRPPPPGLTAKAPPPAPRQPSAGQAATAGKRGSMAPALPPVPAAPKMPSGGSQQLALLPPPPPPLAVLPPPPAGPGGTTGVGANAVALALPEQPEDQAAAGKAAGTTLAMVNAAPPKARGATSGKAFMIPGMQSRPYTDEELILAWDMMDLDRHGQLVASDIRRVLGLCGEASATDAEVAEMIRIADPDGSGEVEYREFYAQFKYPPALFRNFDFSKADAIVGLGEESPMPGSPERPRSADASEPSSRGSARARDMRPEALATILGGRSLKPEFIKQVYKRFVDIDTENYGFVTYDSFCLALQRARSDEMRRAFDVFDIDNAGELDLRQFIVGLSMFTASRAEDRLRLAFMMYDEDQRSSISRADLADMLKAIAPHFSSHQREAHLSRAYSTYSLHPNSRIALDEVLAYMQDHEEELMPPRYKRRGSVASQPPEE